MQLHSKLEALIDEMLDGRLLLDEAVCRIRKGIYPESSSPAQATPFKYRSGPGNPSKHTLKRVASYQKQERTANRAAKGAAG